MAKVRLPRPIREFHRRVQNRLGMHHDIDPVVRDVKQVVGLDDLQSLVEQSRGVNRDPLPHIPGGVRQGLFGGHPDQGLLAATSKWAA